MQIKFNGQYDKELFYQAAQVANQPDWNTRIINPVEFSYFQGLSILKKRKAALLKKHGQFLTPPDVARYMAGKLEGFYDGMTILEPAAGSGVLLFALLERLLDECENIDVFIDIYELDTELLGVLTDTLEAVEEQARKKSIVIHKRIYKRDFILAATHLFYPTLFSRSEDYRKYFDFILSNPPYFKLKSDDERVKVIQGKVEGHTNIYTLFMAFGSRMLTKKGTGVFIVPRSFCSGTYFSKFRREFIAQVMPVAAHLFKSRGEVFGGSNVLQENLILTFKKKHKPRAYRTDTIAISASQNGDEMTEAIPRYVSFKHFLANMGRDLFFRFPMGLLDEKIIETVDCWEDNLSSLGLKVSTGKVVPFRAKSLLFNSLERQKSRVPLLWMNHVQPNKIEWFFDSFKKEQFLSTEDESLLAEKKNYVLVRRFSAKEDARRIIAAPFIGDAFDYDYVGFENHLNVIYKRKGQLEDVEAVGLSAILNSALLDRYFRILNGNTQVNATELRLLPLPPLNVVRLIGHKVNSLSDWNSEIIDRVVFEVLRDTHLIDKDFPLIQETRIKMGKIEQAQKILEALGLPSAQQNEISALTLLSLANLDEDTFWSRAEALALRIHDILNAIKEKYGREYAENTRETIRRQVLHQFVQAGIAIRNPKDPSLPTNSPRTHYGISPLALDAIRAYGSNAWDEKCNDFLSQKGALLEVYRNEREQYKVPLYVSENKVLKLSPGKHNELQAAVIEEFGPRFAPGAKLLYVGDTAKKTLILEEEDFKSLGVMIEDHGKLPDVVLFDKDKNWLFLIEAVTSHGPVSPKRQVELEKMFESCSAALVFVTAFIDFSTFKRFSSEIAWETEVWIEAMPSHMIHFNGDKFMGPHK